MAAQFFRNVSLFLLALAGLTLIGLAERDLGWAFWVLGITTLLATARDFRRHMVLAYISVGILGLTPISTDMTYAHILKMGGALMMAVLLPFFLSRFVYRDPTLVRFPWHHGRNWYRREVAYIAVTAIVTYFLLPFYLQDTGAYLNWTVEPGIRNIGLLFLGTNALGLWDELFFVSTVLGVLRKHFPFWIANAAQAVLFTSFLHELGFTGWAFLPLYFFALLQGYIFRKTESLLYIVTIHLTLDLILFLALLHAHHPVWMPIFPGY